MVSSIDARKRLWVEMQNYRFIDYFDYFKLGGLYTGKDITDNDVIESEVSRAERFYGKDVVDTVVDFYNGDRRSFAVSALKVTNEEPTVAIADKMFELMSFWLVKNNDLLKGMNRYFNTDKYSNTMKDVDAAEDTRPRMWKELNEYKFIKSFDYFLTEDFYADDIDKLIEEARYTYGQTVVDTVIDFYNGDKDFLSSAKKILRKIDEIYVSEWITINKFPPGFIKKIYKILSGWKVNDDYLLKGLRVYNINDLLLNNEDISDIEYLHTDIYVLSKLVILGNNERNLAKVIVKLVKEHPSAYRQMIRLASYEVLEFALAKNNYLNIYDMIINSLLENLGVFEGLVRNTKLVKMILLKNDYKLYKLVFQTSKINNAWNISDINDARDFYYKISDDLILKTGVFEIELIFQQQKY